MQGDCPLSFLLVIDEDVEGGKGGEGIEVGAMARILNRQECALLASRKIGDPWMWRNSPHSFSSLLTCIPSQMNNTHTISCCFYRVKYFARTSPLFGGQRGALACALTRREGSSIGEGGETDGEMGVAQEEAVVDGA